MSKHENITTITDAIDALRPFSQKRQTRALQYIREHWEEAEPILIDAIAQKLTDPTTEDTEALFLYAIHLCAEMKSTRAFPYFVKIARLPNVVLDCVMGDILTETLPHMLARTCNGRIANIQALVEDPSLNEFARSAAMRALLILVGNSELDKATLSTYCIDLLSEKLERIPSYIWDCVIRAICKIGTPDALPLIEAAYDRHLTEDCDFEYTADAYKRALTASPETIRDAETPFCSTEDEMALLQRNWEPVNEISQKELLAVLKDDPMHLTAPKPDIGRNDPCPCGSGKKFKKCCIDKPEQQISNIALSVRGNPIRTEHRVADNWMRAGYIHANRNSEWKAFECWKRCWEELLRVLPPELQDPELAETTGTFEGSDYLFNWLQDFQFLLVDNARATVETATYTIDYCEAVPRRFANISQNIIDKMRVDRAHCMAMLGKQKEAIQELENMIAERPKEALSYVALAEMVGSLTDTFNMRPDIPRAIQYLQNAKQNTADWEDYDIDDRINELNAWKQKMNTPITTPLNLTKQR